MIRRFVPFVPLLLGLCAVPVYAQSAAAEEETVNYTLPTDEWYVPKNTISFGFRMLNKGASVKFHNLGAFTGLNTGIADANGNRSYDSGFVSADFARLTEAATNPVPDPPTTNGTSVTYTAVVGSRYQFRTITRQDDGTVLPETVTGDYLLYQAGQTRNWSTQNAALVSGGVVAMRNYRAVSDGASAQKDEGLNTGIELSLNHAFGKLGKRFEWGITAGLALNTINAKTSGDVRSTLVTSSTTFNLNGTLPSGATGGPTFGDLPNNGLDDDGLYETTAPLSTTPNGTTTTSVAGAADVRGNWQVKGAYFLMRVGPSIRTQLTERFGVSASLGVAGAFAGTRYSVVERLYVADLPDPLVEEKDAVDGRFLAGLYADMNLDWAATERTGLFAGVNMQQFGSYDTSVAGRTAKVELGNAVGLRGGINIRF